MGLLLVTSSLSMANVKNSENLDAYTTHYANVISSNHLKSFTDGNEKPMVLIAQRDEYTLYRCESNLFPKVTSSQLTGKDYHYLVYKNNKLHLSVNKRNQKSVYQFFTNNEPK